MRATRPRDVFDACGDTDKPSLSVRAKIGSGSFGEAFSADVSATNPWALSVLPGDVKLVVKRCIVGRMGDEYKLTRTAETRETMWARELGGIVPWRAILEAEAEASARDGAGAGAGAGAATRSRIYLPLAPTFAGATLAHEGGETDRVFHLLATAAHGCSIHEAVMADPARFARDPALSLSIAAQVLRLVAELHGRAGAVHRDIKLQNLLLTWSPSSCPVVRLCDLGSARVGPTSVAAAAAPAPAPAPTTALALATGTGTGTGIGTGTGTGTDDTWGNAHARGAGTPFVTSLWYRAPELICGSLWSGPPADAWAVGVALAELYSLAASLAPDAGAGGAAAQTAAGRREGVSARCGKNGALKFGKVWVAPETGAGPGAGAGVAPETGVGVSMPAVVSVPAPLPGAAQARSRTTPTPPDTPPPDTADLVTLFHCGPEDAYAVLSIINILGLPSTADIADLRLPRMLLGKVMDLCTAVRMRAGAEPRLGSLPVAEILQEHFSVPHDMACVLARLLVWAPSSRATCAEALADKTFASAGFYESPEKKLD